MRNLVLADIYKPFPWRMLMDRKVTTKKLSDKDFAELSGELSVGIFLKALVLLVMPLNCSDSSLFFSAVRTIFWFCRSFWPLKCCVVVLPEFLSLVTDAVAAFLTSSDIRVSVKVKRGRRDAKKGTGRKTSENVMTNRSPSPPTPFCQRPPPAPPINVF